MKRIWLAVAGVGFLVCAGCPVSEEMGDVEVTVYGRLKADLIADSADPMPAGEAMQWVDDAATATKNFVMGASDTRFGIDFAMGEGLTGKVEMDLFSMVLFGTWRQAYAKMDIGNDMSLLAGQTRDVFSPLFPDVLNYAEGWYAGNTGAFHPQIRWEMQKSGVDIQAALSDPILADAAFPDVQWRVAFKLGDESAVKMGVSGVFGSTDYDGGAATESMFGLAVDIEANLGDKLAIRGEYYLGSNLDAYMGGISEQGVKDTLGSTGLWAHVVIKLSDDLKLNAGMMFDANTDADIVAGERKGNISIFGSLRYQVNENTEAGLEISSWTTDYKGDKAYTDLRIQTSLIVNF